MTLKQLIKKGNFDWVNPGITEENFPQNEIRGTDYKLFHFDEFVSSEEAIKRIASEGYLPANIYELLNWDDWNNEDIVIGLGSAATVGLSRNVPGLWSGDDGRELDLRWAGHGWLPHCRFLGVRNSQTLETQTLEATELSPSEPLTLGEEIIVNGVKYKRV